MNETTVKVIARTYEVSEIADKLYGGDESKVTESLIGDSTVFSGKAAGVCYMPDDYAENGIQNKQAAVNRAKTTDKNTHHSTYDHAHVSLLVHSNKMIAMILNSLGCYATSEKSARFTKMHPETERELELYNKWLVRIRELVLKAYPWYDDAELTKRLHKKTNNETWQVYEGKITNECGGLIEAAAALGEIKTSETLPSYKIAQENARYMISVFTPTTFVYTVSIRRAFEIAHMLRKMYINCTQADDEFSKKLIPHLLSASAAFQGVIDNNNVHDIKIRDSKNQYIRFLTAQHVGDLITNPDGSENFVKFDDMKRVVRPMKLSQTYGDVYDITYCNSLAALAQMQRHRTIDYTMTLQKAGEFGFYVPEIVKHFHMQEEWLADIESVAYCIPQGTLVRIRETGNIYYFALKCKERMCGRAQLETMNRVNETLKGFINNEFNLSPEGMRILHGITCNDKRAVGLTTCARCKYYDYTCTEGCVWGPDTALTRLI